MNKRFQSLVDEVRATMDGDRIGGDFDSLASSLSDWTLSPIKIKTVIKKLRKVDVWCRHREVDEASKKAVTFVLARSKQV